MDGVQTVSIDVHTKFQEPSLSVWIKESVCEVVPIILWDLKWLILDAFIQVLKRVKMTTASIK